MLRKTQTNTYCTRMCSGDTHMHPDWLQWVFPGKSGGVSVPLLSPLRHGSNAACGRLVWDINVCVMSVQNFGFPLSTLSTSRVFLIGLFVRLFNCLSAFSFCLTDWLTDQLTDRHRARTTNYDSRHELVQWLRGPPFHSSGRDPQRLDLLCTVSYRSQ